jgi:hypothetical protein
MDEPPPDAAAEAKRNPGGWVYAIAPGHDPDGDIPPEGIIGAWKVDDAGRIAGEFIPNPNHRPDAASRGILTGNPTYRSDAPIRNAVIEPRQRRPWQGRKWVWAAALWLLVAYPLSMGPAVYAHRRGWVDGQTVEVVYGPALRVLLSNGTTGSAFLRYLTWWVGLTQPDNAATD